MTLLPLALPGCFALDGAMQADERGGFHKLFHAPSFAALGLETGFVESYVSTSRRGVVRGLHLQTPPSDHAKLVVCLGGRARDALLDLRVGSPTFGRAETLLLTPDEPRALYVPRGVAHGFAALADDTRLLYFVSSVHDPAADTGVRWDSAGIDWWQGEAAGEPVVSARDRALPALRDFRSPFVFGTAA
jgi:dTDP-4-dehydrorhamnose 3,5-epimerase